MSLSRDVLNMVPKFKWFFLYCHVLITYGNVDFIESSEDELYAGDLCQTSDLKGVCKTISSCSVAIERLKKNNGHHNLKQCGFIGDEQVVCCPLAGDMCEIMGTRGICTFAESCSMPENRPLYACHHQYSQIVCCPATSILKNPVNNNQRLKSRKCEEECDKIQFKSTAGDATFHIIDGDLAEEGEFPHMVALGYKGDEGISWECGATIISDKFLLTAAHCFKKGKPEVARMGITKLNDTNYKDFGIGKITLHDKYNPESKHNDIALVEVKETIDFSDKITPACLYVEDDDPDMMIVSGWGKTSIGNEDDRSNHLQKATLKPAPRAFCNETYYQRSYGTKSITSTQLCAKGVNNRSDACWGDSGGPLQIRDKTELTGKFFIVGIISYGSSCGGKTPGVYTRVSSFLDWIEKRVWPQQ